MLIQAARLALLAALSPTALLVAAVYLGSAQPLLATPFYLAASGRTALVIVGVINGLLVWVPIVIHLIAPGFATRYLTAFNGWLRAHGKLILICVLAAVGGIMTVNGIYGLVAVR